MLVVGLLEKQSARIAVHSLHLTTTIYLLVLFSVFGLPMPSLLESLPTLRDASYGWLHFCALGYALAANLLGLYSLLQWHQQHQEQVGTLPWSLALLLTGILASAHGRVIASYLVHEAAHGNIFRNPLVEGNRAFGVAALCLAGCPYADFGHVKSMHISHHKDRADTVEFDYRTFARLPAVKPIMLALEYFYVPAVETVMHTRTAFSPLIWPSLYIGTSRTWSSAIGVSVQATWYAYLFEQGILLPHLVAGALVLQYLSLNDAFHHTFEVLLMENYTPGPGSRTAQYEEDNTYSNLVSTRYPLLNLLSLNFGYHNAHHEKILTPWYGLPALHESLYGSPAAAAESTVVTNDSKKTDKKSINTCSTYAQLLPFGEILHAFHVHRLRRVLEEDYGVVHSVDTPHRAKDFVGSLGVSFLTV